MDWPRLDTRWWNLSLGIVTATVMSACGPTIMLDADDGDTITDSDGPDDLPPNTTFPDDVQCELAVDCGGGFDCVDGQCVPIGDYHDDYYDDYYDYCDYGCCDGGCWYDECFSEYECGQGEVCSEYECQTVPTLPECAPVELVPLPLPEGEATGEVVSLSFIDADGDGTDDLLVSRGSGTELYLGPGAEEPIPVPLPDGDAIHDAAVGDFNGDGFNDLSYTDGVDGISILLGDGTGQFTLSYTAPVESPELEQKVLDWNGDGFLDVAGLAGYGRVIVHQSDGSGSFMYHYALPVDSQDHTAFATGNFNGDEFDDVVLQDGRDGVMFLGNSTADMSADQYLWTANLEDPYGRKMLAGDFNGSGVSEILGHTNTFSDWALLEAYRDAGETRFMYAIDGQVDVSDVGDIDGDGAADVVLANPDVLTLILGQSEGGEAEFLGCQRRLFPDAPVEKLALGDLDGDGRAEIVTADGSTLVVWTTQ